MQKQLKAKGDACLLLTKGTDLEYHEEDDRTGFFQLPSQQSSECQLCLCQPRTQ